MPLGWPSVMGMQCPKGILQLWVCPTHPTCEPASLERLWGGKASFCSLLAMLLKGDKPLVTAKNLTSWKRLHRWLRIY